MANALDPPYTDFTAKVTFYISAKMEPSKILEELQWALNTACTQLEDRLPTGRCTSYRLGDTSSEIS